jgi:hypothetical protein
MSIPVGYCTVPEALRVIGLRASDGKPFSWLDAALADGLLRMFVLRLFESGPVIMRIPQEDIEQLRSEMNGWDWWLPEGRVPEPPEVKCNPEFTAWLSDFERQGPRPKEFLEGQPYTPTLSRYSKEKLLIEEAELHRWCATWLAPAPQTLITKTGAPGRPTSMGVVIAEFERRRTNEMCESSRDAEAKALEAWVKKTHPDLPAPTAKTIRNKLPQDFQPFTERRRKL